LLFSDSFGSLAIFTAIRPRLNPSKGRNPSLTVLVKHPDANRPHGVTTEDNMRLLVLGLATLALSAVAASAQPATPVYPRYGYAPYGYGYGYAHGYGYHHRYYHHRYYAYHPRYHRY